MRGERGQSILELALILPILLMLIVGIVEFGRAWMTMNILTGAVREGARIAAITPDIQNNKQSVINVVTGLLGSANLEPEYVRINPDDQMNNMVRVSAAVNFLFIPVPFFELVFGESIMMVRSASCYYEGQL